MENFKLSEDGKSFLKYNGQESKVIIPEGVEEINSSAFVKCDTIISVVLPASNIKIHKRAFINCVNLSEINVTKNVDFNACSFCNCTKLKLPSIIIDDALIFVPASTEGKYVIPQNVTRISEGAFCGREKITEVIIPESVKYIGHRAFNGCYSLDKIIIPSSVTEIDSEAIVDCNLMQLTVDKGNEVYDSRENCNAIIETESNTLILGCCNTQFPKSVSSIGKSAFYGCSRLNEITIPNTISSIEIGAFSFCKNLKKVFFEEGNKRPFFWAFTWCENLRHIVLPESYESIEDWVENNEAFDNDYCYAMSEIQMIIENPIYNKRIFVLLPVCFEGEFTVPDGITHIEPYAFADCSELTRVILPESITYIGKNAFEGCSKLQEINIPNHTRIASKAFAYCGTLNTTTAIISDKKLFRVGVNEKTYVIDDGITTIEAGAFKNCCELESIVIPDSIKIIDNNAFESCTSLESIVIPNSVKELGHSIFKGCKKLQHVVLPNSLSYIPSETFCGCESLQEMILPDKITKIASSSFRNCTSLRKIIVTSKLEEIGNCAFENCSSLEQFYERCVNQSDYLPGSQLEILFNGISIPETVTSIGDYAFIGCSAANGLEFKAKFSLIEIGKSAFKGCKLIKMVDLPEGLKAIKESTFEDCESLGLISVPYSTRTIHTTAFEGCKNIVFAELPSGWDGKREILGLPPARRIYDGDGLGQSPDGEMIYTRGRFSPCPYCGYDGTTTYIDGTAQCNHCKCWFRYEYP